ncbi:hypothetical protein [Pararobbsia alpina]|uniref:Uncharacterized protein n=1 Tax=Pararobbsia alpina TaxID=621374 RepID=A0A6S7BHW0_9BURK|nr:hypothetical protein [Pararobbsia alpina]CAB3799314.1 hypothetical protein LMG28138_04635 [Pararobbsia alpina]
MSIGWQTIGYWWKPLNKRSYAYYFILLISGLSAGKWNQTFEGRQTFPIVSHSSNYF